MLRVAVRRLAAAAAPKGVPSVPLGAGKASPMMTYPKGLPAELGKPKSLGGLVANTLLYASGMQSRDAVGMRRARESYKSIGSIYDAQKSFFCQSCALPDTFQSWFLVTHMHIWFVIVRLRAEGEAGKAVSQQIMQLFFDDMEHRMADIGITRIDKNMRLLISQYFGVSLAYDEAMLKNDTDLAEAVWRNVTDMNGSPVEVARIVQYMKMQGARLDKVASEQALQGEFTFADPALV